MMLGAPALAQSTAQDEPDEGAVIIVTGRGLAETPGTPAYATRALEREQIVTSPSGRIEDVLGAVAGFQQFRRSDSRSSNPSAQGATLRALGGNATSRALVLLDGVPQADPFFGTIPFSAIAPERLARIRVTRGGGAGPFGAGALAGTIELESAAAATLGPLLASALVNDRGDTETTLIGATRVGSGEVVAGARWDRGPGFFTTPRDQRVPASVRAGFDSWSGDLRLVAPVGSLAELQANASVFRDDRTLRFDGADSSSEGQDASVRLVARGDWQVDALAYLQARNFSNVVVSSTRFVPVLDQRNTPSTGIGGKLELRPPVGADTVLRLGVDYRHADGELQEEALSAFTGAVRERRRAGGATANLGLFAEGDRAFGPVTLTGGVRADRTSVTEGFFEARNSGGAPIERTAFPDRSDWDVSLRGGAVWRLDDTLALRAAAYRGFRLPTLNELYRPFVVFPVVTEANADLRNERLRGFEAGLDWAPAPGVELALTAFDNRIEDAIANVTIGDNLRQRRNLPAIEARGIEAGLAASRGTVRFDATLAYTDAAIVGEGASAPLDGNRPPQSPRWSAAANIAWTPVRGATVAATLRHVGAQFESDLETDRLPPATTLGAYAHAPLIGAVSLVLRAENLTGETIVTRNADGTFDLGAPRTGWIGLRYGF